MRPLATLLVLLSFAAAVHAQGNEPRFRLLLEVRDAETGDPLVGAHVGAGDVLRVTNTDGQVLFRNLTPGPLDVGAAFLGYTSVDTSITLERSARLAFMLQPEPRALGQIAVEGERVNTARLERVGFFERSENRSGTFIDADDLQQKGAVAFSDVFRGVAGLRIETSYGQAYLTSTRRRNCSPAIFLDGTHARHLEEFLDSIAMRDILAIEIYKGPSQVPVEYSASINGTDCGAVLVWTRAR